MKKKKNCPPRLVFKKMLPAIKAPLLNPFEHALKVLGSRACIRNGTYRLDGSPVTSFHVINEANKVLREQRLPLISLTKKV